MCKIAAHQVFYPLFHPAFLKVNEDFSSVRGVALVKIYFMTYSQEMRKMTALGVIIPFVLAVPPIVGLWVGGYLDTWLGTKPYFFYGLLILGVLAGARETIRIIKAILE